MMSIICPLVGIGFTPPQVPTALQKRRDEGGEAFPAKIATLVLLPASWIIKVRAVYEGKVQEVQTFLRVYKFQAW